MVKRASAIVGVTVVVWALAYAGFWLSHSGCFATFTQACLDAPIEPVRAFIMLDWLWAYQTLMSGLMTLLAGLSVVFVYSMQRKHAAADSLRSIRETRISTLVDVRVALLAIGDALDLADYQALDLARQRLHAGAVEVGRFAPSFSILILQIWSLVEVDRPNPIDPRIGIREQRILAFQAAGTLARDAAMFFYDERRLINGRGDWAFSAMRYKGKVEDIAPLVRRLFKFN